MNSAPATPLSDEQIRSAVCTVSSSHPIKRMQLFGSRARGTARPDSDIDLLVEFSPGARVGLFEMGSLKEELEERLGCRVDLVSRAAVERSRNSIRRQAILTAPVTLYAR